MVLNRALVNAFLMSEIPLTHPSANSLICGPAWTLIWEIVAKVQSFFDSKKFFANYFVISQRI